MSLTIRNLITSLIKKHKKLEYTSEYLPRDFSPCEICPTLECGLINGNECDAFWRWRRSKIQVSNREEV